LTISQIHACFFSSKGLYRGTSSLFIFLGKQILLLTLCLATHPLYQRLMIHREAARLSQVSRLHFGKMLETLHQSLGTDILKRHRRTRYYELSSMLSTTDFQRHVAQPHQRLHTGSTATVYTSQTVSLSMTITWW